MNKNKKWKFAVDRGGTFTDVIGIDPDGRFHTEKLLSSSPEYSDASIEGIRRVLGLSGDGPLPQEKIEEIRFGTTVATNALLERKGGRVALCITRGMADLLEIGYQARPDIFALAIEKHSPLYSMVIEVNERIDSAGGVVSPFDTKAFEEGIETIKESHIDTVAVVFMHSWKNNGHELLCREILEKNGIKEVFLSHETMTLIKIVSRGQSTVIDAYLSPVIHRYLDGIKTFTGSIPIEFMQSSGTLSHPDHFLGKDAILSGPAGGVIGVASLSTEAGLKGVIGFDMGGTSTDVSRYDGELDKIYEGVIEGIDLQKEMLNIKAVAAGGGSILHFDGQRMLAGPQSAGAEPGPACYGFGGPLTLTDANLITGRIAFDFFPKSFGPHRNAPLDKERSRSLFKDLTCEINRSMGTNFSVEEAAAGFLRIANEKMALAIKEISISRGIDVRDYRLVCFGGAGGQHACQVASLLGMQSVIFHPLGGVMSAYGMGLANRDKKAVRTVLMEFSRHNCGKIESQLSIMEERLLPSMSRKKKVVTRQVDIRPRGAESFITVNFNAYDETLSSFTKEYEKQFGFYPEESPLEVVNLRVQVSETSNFFPPFHEDQGPEEKSLRPLSTQKIVCTEGSHEAPLYLRRSLPLGAAIEGPAIIVDNYSSLVIDPGFTGELREGGIIFIEGPAGQKEHLKSASMPDPVLLEVFNNIFMNISTEMGHTLKNTAHSANIKERLDFSCALFDAQGDLVANAPHIPVHLGSMSDAVKGIMEGRKTLMAPGQIYLTNDPYNGGSHLPDITAVCPVFSETGELIFFTAARGHHADIGGITPGSMPPTASHIDEEGILIKNMLIVKEGHFLEEEARTLLSSNSYPARNMEERISDLRAQVAACHKGKDEIGTLVQRYGIETVKAYMGFIQQNAEFSIKNALAPFLSGKKSIEASFEDCLDDKTPIRVNISIEAGSHPPETIRCIIDFTGTGSEHKHDNLNAPLSVTRSAVIYVLRCLIDRDIPLNSGCLKPVEIVVPEASLLNPTYPSPVASGNVETSQRIVDILLGAFSAAAASQGTMNNFIFQIEGDTPYYETIAGGSGAMEGHKGASAVQVHMTNTRMTDPEILEVRHPHVRIERFSLRRDSGGEGIYKGGDGVIREVKFLKPAQVSLISERRTSSPYGMEGGEAGKKGRNLVKNKEGKYAEMGPRFHVKLAEGESVIIETPGGGGWGKA